MSGLSVGSYKRLKSVAHNLAHSYLSLMNYQGGDYIVEQLFRRARDTGERHVEINVLTATMSPPVLVTPVLAESLARMREWLPRSFAAEGCSLDRVTSVRIKVDFRFEDTQLSDTVPGLELAAYDCNVEILDDRGALHRAQVPEWWRY